MNSGTRGRDGDNAGHVPVLHSRSFRDGQGQPPLGVSPCPAGCSRLFGLNGSTETSSPENAEMINVINGHKLRLHVPLHGDAQSAHVGTNRKTPK